MQDHDVDAVASGAGLDGGRSGVAGRGADDCHARIALGQDMIEQAPQNLHRHILEGESWAVEQFLSEQVGFKLHQRHHGRMTEAGVRVAADRLQHRERNAGADERLHNAGGEGVVGQGTHGAPVGRTEVRPVFRHEQAAILGEAGQQDVGKIAGGGLPSGRDIAHDGVLRGWMAVCPDCPCVVHRGGGIFRPLHGHQT